MVDSLAVLPGQFVLHGDQWRFTGDDDILAAFAQYGDSAVVALVSCLDRTDSAVATVGRRRVPIGVVCYAALIRTAYPLEHEDGSGDWPGFVEPTASLEELRHAKRAWEVVVEKRAYRLP